MREENRKNLKVLVNEIKEKSAEGAFVCDYSVFRQIYQLEARRILRLGIEEYILLFTVQEETHQKADTSDTLSIEKEADRLGEILRKYLRIGDVVTRCNPTQFLVMLPICRHESVKVVAQRIINMFHRIVNTKKISVSYELVELISVNLEKI